MFTLFLYITVRLSEDLRLFFLTNIYQTVLATRYLKLSVRCEHLLRNVKCSILTWRWKTKKYRLIQLYQTVLFRLQKLIWRIRLKNQLHNWIAMKMKNSVEAFFKVKSIDQIVNIPSWTTNVVIWYSNWTLESSRNGILTKANRFTLLWMPYLLIYKRIDWPFNKSSFLSGIFFFFFYCCDKYCTWIGLSSLMLSANLWKV